MSKAVARQEDRRKRLDRGQSIRIVVRGHQAIVPPEASAALLPALQCRLRTFVLGGTCGYTEKRATAAFYATGDDGYVKTHAGLVPRAVKHLTRVGFTVEVCDRTRWLLLEEPTRSFCDDLAREDQKLTAALRSDVEPGLISVNGSAKNRPLLHQAIAAGARITIDHVDELQIIQEEAARLNTTARVRFRLRLRNPDLSQPSDLAPDFTSSEILRRYKPGISFEQTVSLGQRALEMPNVDLAGVHIHIARSSSFLDYWQKAIRTLKWFFWV